MPERRKKEEAGMVPRGDVATATQLAFNPMTMIRGQDRSNTTPTPQGAPSMVPEIVAPPSAANIVPRTISPQPQAAAAPITAQGAGRAAREFIGETIGTAVGAGESIVNRAGRAVAPIAAFGSGFLGREQAPAPTTATTPAAQPAQAPVQTTQPVGQNVARTQGSMVPADVQAAINSTAPGTAVISGMRQNGERIDRVYSRAELDALANRNVISSEAFTNPGAGVALSQATGGRETLAFGQMGQRNAEIAQAQARNQATRDRIAANSMVPRVTEDDRKRQSMVNDLTMQAKNAVDQGKRRTAGAIVNVLNSYGNATQGQGRSMVPQQARPTSNEQTPQQPTALDQAKLASESAQARAAQISTQQAEQVYALQQQLLNAPESERPAIQAQIETLTGKYRPQARQQNNGEITNRDRFADLSKRIVSELDPTERAKLIQEQKALDSGGAQQPTATPPGSKQIGTSGGVPVFEDENGNRFTL